MIVFTLFAFALVVLVMAFYASTEESYHRGLVVPDSYEPPQERERDWSFLTTWRWWLHVAITGVVLFAWDRIFNWLWPA
jgi:hypothetical protein